MCNNNMSPADKAFLDWYNAFMALPHEYTEEVFRIHARNMEQLTTKTGSEVSVPERIASVKSAATEIVARVATAQLRIATYDGRDRA